MDIWQPPVTCDIEYDVTMQDGVMLVSVSLVVGIGLEMNCGSFELIPVCVWPIKIMTEPRGIERLIDL